ncbi:hypothetical protein GBA63_02930 [Rubrobacter tropicus]|uniref:Uncharacterized protein n=1 Tax=Rubrobacter tropicus TaxID=2653851 RepID=A0A6G8Q5I4_9ACTN|nr:hypothetical protein [Rubrobacter tropicus]QIN81703.1 hypothetical protein GBA63_02930 [Rubrobacter tropicus]
MDRPYRTKSRNLFRLWTEHDLADHGPEFGSYRPAFYEGLRREDEPVVWKFIEENYLRKYRCFVRVGFDWMADGLWEIPFPGSVSMGLSSSPENFGMPEPLSARIHAWQANLDSREPGAEPEEEDFDYRASDAEGVEIAGEVMLFLGSGYYVEYRPFREVSIRDGGAVELEVPAFITDLTR